MSFSLRKPSEYGEWAPAIFALGPSPILRYTADVRCYRGPLDAALCFRNWKKVGDEWDSPLYVEAHRQQMADYAVTPFDCEEMTTVDKDIELWILTPDDKAHFMISNWLHAAAVHLDIGHELPWTPGVMLNSTPIARYNPMNTGCL